MKPFALCEVLSCVRSPKQFSDINLTIKFRHPRNSWPYYTSLVPHISDLLIRVFSFKAINFSIYYCTFSVDILWFVLCGHQSLSQTSHLHREDCVCIQRKTPPRNASPYLLNLWQCISWYVARSWESVHVDHVSKN